MERLSDRVAEPKKRHQLAYLKRCRRQLPRERLADLITRGVELMVQRLQRKVGITLTGLLREQFRKELQTNRNLFFKSDRRSFFFEMARDVSTSVFVNLLTLSAALSEWFIVSERVPAERGD